MIRKVFTVVQCALGLFVESILKGTRAAFDLFSNESTVSAINRTAKGRERAKLYLEKGIIQVPNWRFMSYDDQVTWVYYSKKNEFWIN